MTNAAGASGSAAGSGGASAAPSGPSLCSSPDLLFCEGFEADAIDKSVWKTMTSAPSLDSTRAARGAKSLHVHTAAVGASGLQTSKFLSRAQGHYYGRMFVWFDALPTSPAWAHWTIVGASAASSASDQSEIRVGGQADGKKVERWGVGTDHGPTGDWTNLDDDPQGAAQPVQLKQWQCLEWLHDWTHDETRFYLNGVEHASLRTTRDVKRGGNTNVPYDIPDLASVWVGFWNYDQGDGGKKVMPTQFDVWIDEVAFDDERIGCDK